MIILAKSAGFCFGVKNAVDTVYENLETKKLVTYGPIIHNKHITDDLREKGVRIIENFENITDETVIIRSHGVTRAVYDYMEKNNITYIDCTCPYVKKIHNIVSNKDNIIIIGNPTHPEVIGIAGHGGKNIVILSSVEQVEHSKFDCTAEYIVVAQTTFVRNIFEKIVGAVKSVVKNVQIFDTICNATTIRQTESEKLSKKVDKMLVIGDKNSSNTSKLYEICKQNCKRTFFIENINEIVLKNFDINDKIGITAGASTPSAVIKEALTIMSEQENQEFADLLDSSLVTLHTGQVVKGTIISVTNNEISVNLGYKSDGIITKAELTDEDIDMKAMYKPGDEIESLVVRVNDGDGNVLLSRKRIDDLKKFDVIEELFNSKEIVTGKIVEIVKGGLMARIKGVKIFVPSSQIASRFTEDLSQFKGQELDFQILEFNREKRRMVAGRKDLARKQEDSKKEAALSRLAVDMDVEGIISRVVAFGVFVDLGDIDGLIHISELGWTRNKKSSMKVGDKVSARVISVDREKHKIGLSVKALLGNPWDGIEQRYTVDSVVEGKVVRLVDFGAFIELEADIDGLVHISEISHTRVAKAENVLKVGEIVKVKVMKVDVEAKKISLSIKALEEKPETVEEVATETTETVE